MVKSSYVSDITTYLKERYYPIQSKDDVIYMIDAKQETAALVSVYTSGYSAYVMVTYAQYTGEKVYKILNRKLSLPIGKCIIKYHQKRCDDKTYQEHCIGDTKLFS